MKIRSVIGMAFALLSLLVSPAAFAIAFNFDTGYSDPAVTNSTSDGRAPACDSDSCEARAITTTQNGFSVSITAGLTNSNLAYYSSFNRHYYADVNVYWNGGLEHGGLGIEAGQDQSNCSGASNSMQGSCGGWRLDEVLFLDFGSEINFMSARFNGGETDLSGAGADFDIYIGDGFNNYTRIINDAVPNGPDYIGIDALGQYFAIVADDGLDVGYLQSLNILVVPEPGILALFGVGILGLGFASRKKI